MTTLGRSFLLDFRPPQCTGVHNSAVFKTDSTLTTVFTADSTRGLGIAYFFKEIISRDFVNFFTEQNSRN